LPDKVKKVLIRYHPWLPRLRHPGYLPAGSGLQAHVFAQTTFGSSHRSHPVGDHV